jgi:hypothetical protein
MSAIAVPDASNTLIAAVVIALFLSVQLLMSFSLHRRCFRSVGVNNAAIAVGLTATAANLLHFVK